MVVALQEFKFENGYFGMDGIRACLHVSPSPPRAAFRDRARGPLCMAERPTRGQPHINLSPRIDFWSTEPLRAEAGPKGRR